MQSTDLKKRIPLLLLIPLLMFQIPARAEKGLTETYPINSYPILGGNPQRTHYVEGPAPNEATILWETEYLGAGPVTVSGGRVFFAGYNYSEQWFYHVYCFNQSNGSMIWSKELRWTGDWLPSLTIFKDKMFLAQDNYLRCLDVSSGWELWATYLSGSLQSPVTDGSIVYVSSRRIETPEHIYALNVSNGERLWAVSLSKLTSAPIVTGGTIIINSFDPETKTAFTESYDKYKGDLLWLQSFPDKDIEKWFNYNRQSPSALKDKVFVGIGSSIICLDQATGNMLWEYTTGGEVTTTPAIAYGKVFAASTDGYLYSLDQSSGSLIWKYPIIHQVFISNLLAADGKIFVATGNPSVLYCLSESDGRLIWFQDMGDHTHGLGVADGNLYVSASGYVKVFGEYVVTTRSSITIQSDTDLATRDTPVSISGSLNPMINATVKLQWSIDKDTWFTYETEAINGEYSFLWHPIFGGELYFRALWEGDYTYSSSISEVIQITVFNDEHEMRMYNELQETYSSLKGDYDVLESSHTKLSEAYQALQDEHEELVLDHELLSKELEASMSELSLKTNILYAVSVTAILFMVTTVYFARRLKTA